MSSPTSSKHPAEILSLALISFVLFSFISPDTLPWLASTSHSQVLSGEGRAVRTPEAIRFLPPSAGDAPSLISLRDAPVAAPAVVPVETPSLQDFGGEFLQQVSQAWWVAAEGSFDLPIIQQPGDNPIYVAGGADVITQFGKPAQEGVTGLLAHNYRSGKEFYGLTLGQRITVYYGGDVTRAYQVTSIQRFQKVDHTDIYSDLIDLETNARVSSTEVYNRFYAGSPHVTFQTCLEGEGYLDWGLYFVVAEPLAP